MDMFFGSHLWREEEGERERGREKERGGRGTDREKTGSLTPLELAKWVRLSG